MDEIAIDDCLLVNILNKVVYYPKVHISPCVSTDDQRVAPEHRSNGLSVVPQLRLKFSLYYRGDIEAIFCACDSDVVAICKEMIDSSFAEYPKSY